MDRDRELRALVLANALVVLAEQMLSTTIGWELWQRSHAAFALGLVGLVQTVPVVALFVPAGTAADRRDRRRVAIAATVVSAVCCIALALVSLASAPLAVTYVCLAVAGAARAFQGPALAALLPDVAPASRLAVAAAWSSSAWQAASIVGPALGGLMIALTGEAAFVYVICALVAVLVIVALTRLRPRRRSGRGATDASPWAGLQFVWRTQVVLAALALDLFAVLFGGATALLPIFASDILHVGALGLGTLRAAPAIGAVLAGVLAARGPGFQRAGRALLTSVAGFGMATIAFGLARSFALSLATLLVLGALDNISVVIRETLVLVRTPEPMRGRVSAVHGLCVGLSSELGALESGIAAQLFGPVAAVVLGGCATFAIVGIVAARCREVRRLDLAPSRPNA